jgi:hypothetical protein
MTQALYARMNNKRKKKKESRWNVGRQQGAPMEMSPEEYFPVADLGHRPDSCPL